MQAIPIDLSVIADRDGPNLVDGLLNLTRVRTVDAAAAVINSYPASYCPPNSEMILEVPVSPPEWAHGVGEQLRILWRSAEEGLYGDLVQHVRLMVT